jgi:hypothetical protein
MRTSAVPSLLTPGRIADELGVPLPRVIYVLATRRHILPAARAGTLRLYDRAAVALVRIELDSIDARRGPSSEADKVFFASELNSGKGVAHGD